MVKIHVISPLRVYKVMFFSCYSPHPPTPRCTPIYRWPHTEALIAYAMLYEKRREEKYWDRFVLIYNYTISHFSDIDGGGEWYGYLDRAGKVSHTFKGGPYKGCFHVPRALLFIDTILRRTDVNGS